MGTAIAPDLVRYTRQVIFAGIGEEGQRRLLKARAVVMGCGALGTTIANHLARAGVGELVVVDRDFIEIHNLHRQALFDEEDIRRGLPKAVAAGEKLRLINSEIRIEALVTDVHAGNIESLIAGATVVLDGTDNFASRCLINDACVKHGIPWVYGGILGASGMTMTILPGRTPCLRCLFAEIPPAGSGPTCATAGVVGPTVATLGSLEASEAMKLIAGTGRLNEGLITVDLWQNRFTTVAIPERTKGCPTCDLGRFDFLTAGEAVETTILCNQNAVQIAVRQAAPIDLAALAESLAGFGPVTHNAFLLALKVEGFELTLFPDRRTIIRGTQDPEVAGALYRKVIGSRLTG